MASEAEVKDYMEKQLELHIDVLTDEANVTQLAELACAHFDTYGDPPDYEIPEEYFDWALEVAEGW